MPMEFIWEKCLGSHTYGLKCFGGGLMGVGDVLRRVCFANTTPHQTSAKKRASRCRKCAPTRVVKICGGRDREHSKVDSRPDDAKRRLDQSFGVFQTKYTNRIREAAGRVNQRFDGSRERLDLIMIRVSMFVCLF